MSAGRVPSPPALFVLYIKETGGEMNRRPFMCPLEEIIPRGLFFFFPPLRVAAPQGSESYPLQQRWTKILIPTVLCPNSLFLHRVSYVLRNSSRAWPSSTSFGCLDTMNEKSKELTQALSAFRLAWPRSLRDLGCSPASRITSQITRSPSEEGLLFWLLRLSQPHRHPPRSSKKEKDKKANLCTEDLTDAHTLRVRPPAFPVK